jgi:hypothetical protein
LRSKNNRLQYQLDELSEKFQAVSSDFKNLQDTNKFLMEVNEEFGIENDKIRADLAKYENNKLNADLERYQISTELPTKRKHESKSKKSKSRRKSRSKKSKSRSRSKKSKSRSRKSKSRSRSRKRYDTSSSSESSESSEDDSSDESDKKINEQKARVCDFLRQIDDLY